MNDSVAIEKGNKLMFLRNIHWLCFGLSVLSLVLPPVAFAEVITTSSSGVCF